MKITAPIALFQKVLAFAVALSAIATPLLRSQAPTAWSDLPRVPRYPLGWPENNIPRWDHLSPVCLGTRLQDLKPAMQSFVDYGSILGAVTLVDRRGMPVQVDAVGAFQPDTIFQIMSMTKPFVAVLIMKLVEEGKIPSVDVRVSALAGCKDFPHTSVTIKQLLTHTSGIWPVHDSPSGSVWGIAPHLTNSLDKDPMTTTRDKTLAFVARHYSNPSFYPLGSNEPTYSNIGYTMLGWIIERLTGEPLERVMKRVILDPLGLKDTFFFPDTATEKQRERIADLDRRLPDPAEYRHYDKARVGWRYASPEGGLYSTAKDLHSFLLLFRNHGQPPDKPRIVGAASIERLMKDELKTQSFCGDPFTGHSLGFLVVRYPGVRDFPGLSPGTIFHWGRFSTEFWYDPQKDEIGIFLYQIVTVDQSTPSRAERDAFKQILARIPVLKSFP